MNLPVTFSLAGTAIAFDCARELFKEYAQSLPIDLAFQLFDQELAALPEQYGSPSGAWLLAYYGGQLAGWVGVRALSPGTAELKRLYV